MGKKKKQNQGGAGQARPMPKPPAAGMSTETLANLPAPLRALDADYSALLRMRNVRWLIVFGAVIAALLLGWYLSSVFVPLLVALATAYILNPLVGKLQKKGVSRTRAVLWIFLLFIVLSAAIGTWFVASIVRDVSQMGTQLGDLINKADEDQESWVASYNEFVPARMELDPAEVNLEAIFDVARAQLVTTRSQVETAEESSARASIAAARADLLVSFQRLDQNNDMQLSNTELTGATFAEIDANKDATVTTGEWFAHFGAAVPKSDSTTLTPEAQKAAEGVWSVVSGGLMTLFSFLLFITLVPIYTWYFMTGFDRVVAKGRQYLPGAHRDRIERILKEVDGMLRAFFRGRIVVVIIITAATTIVYLVFGIQYAVLLGLMSGLGVLIPYFSMVAGWIPAILICLVTKEDPWPAIIGMSIGFHVIQALEQYVLTPKLLGDAVELHPVTLLVGVFVMASLFGIFGALLAVPLTAIAKTLGREFLLPYFKSLAAEKPSARAPPAGA